MVAVAAPPPSSGPGPPCPSWQLGHWTPQLTREVKRTFAFTMGGAWRWATGEGSSACLLAQGDGEQGGWGQVEGTSLLPGPKCAGGGNR